MKWLRRVGPVERDRLLAAVLFVAAQIELAAVAPDGAPLALCALAVAGFTLPFALRRRHALPVAVVVVGSILLVRLALTEPTDFFLPFLAALTAAYGVGAYADRGALAGLALTTVGVTLISVLAAEATVVGDYLFPTAFAVIAWTAGRTVRTRTQLTEALHEAAVREQEAHEHEARAAAAEERRRIAREMHDVVAHSVSVMVVQAGGARRILDRDPARAVAAAEEIERTGREALAEMRRLLGILHHDDKEHAVRVPQPTMRSVGALVARAREAGLPVELHEDGTPRELPAGLDLAAFRVVQEGLTNALKYGDRSPTEVHVGWGERELELEIADRGPGPAGERGDGGGHGLLGMRERVRLYGGELEAGGRRGGGFRVHAKLPLVAEDAQVETAA
jgi:signal transduction histidine kinase